MKTEKEKWYVINHYGIGGEKGDVVSTHYTPDAANKKCKQDTANSWVIVSSNDGSINAGKYIRY